MWKNIIILNNNEDKELISDIQHIFSKEAVFDIQDKVPVVNPIIFNKGKDNCYLLHENTEGVDMFYVNTNKINVADILTNLGIVINCEYVILSYAGDELYCYDTYKDNSYVGVAYNIKNSSNRDDILDSLVDKFGVFLLNGVCKYKVKLDMLLGKLTALLKLTIRQDKIVREFMFSIFCLVYMRDMWTNIFITKEGYSNELQSISNNKYHNLTVINNIKENVCNCVKNNYSIFDSDIDCSKFMQDTQLEHNALLISICNILGVIYVSYYDKNKGWLFNIESLNNSWDAIQTYVYGVSSKATQEVKNIKKIIYSNGKAIADKLNFICRKYGFSTIHFNTDIKKLLNINKGM